VFGARREPEVLPDRHLEWRDVGIGAVVTAVLFTVGKSLIGWYIGSSAVASSYGAAGALIVLLLWVYYSAQIFLLGSLQRPMRSDMAAGRRSPLSVWQKAAQSPMRAVHKPGTRPG
jgi:membrane protein